MRYLVLILCAIVGLVLVAGCTTNTAPVVTPVPTTREAPLTTAPVAAMPTTQADILPASIIGTWYLHEIMYQGAPVNLTYWDRKVTVTFDSDGTAGGNDGCNLFTTHYTLSNQTASAGNNLTIGPDWGSTAMGCNRPGDPEASFSTIFSHSANYTIIPPGKLMTSDTRGNSLIFATTPPEWDPKDFAIPTPPIGAPYFNESDCEFIHISDRYGQLMESDLKELRAALVSRNNEAERQYAMNISANSKSAHDLLVKLPVTDNLSILQAASIGSFMNYQLGADMVLDRLDAKPPRYEFSFSEPLDQGDELYSGYMTIRDNLALQC